MKITKEIIDKLIHEETPIFKYGFSVTSQIEYYYTEKFFNEDKTQSYEQARKIMTNLYGTKHVLKMADIHGVVMIDDDIFGYSNHDTFELQMFTDMSDYYLSVEEAKNDYLASVSKEYVIELPTEHAFISLSPFFNQNNIDNITKCVEEMNKLGKKAEIIQVPKENSK